MPPGDIISVRSTDLEGDDLGLGVVSSLTLALPRLRVQCDKAPLSCWKPAAFTSAAHYSHLMLGCRETKEITSDIPQVVPKGAKFENQWLPVLL